MTVFPNAKSKLLGEPENSIGIINTTAVAGLSGSLSLASGDTDEGVSTGAGATGAGQAPTSSAGDAQVTVNVVNPNSIVVFAIGGGASNQGGFKPVAFNVEESAVVKASTGSINGSVAFNIYGYAGIAIIFNVAVGSHTYDIIKTSGVIHATEVTVEVIEVNDTHAGNIATPATATKQVNTPDTHTTQEIEVIS